MDNVCNHNVLFVERYKQNYLYGSIINESRNAIAGINKDARLYCTAGYLTVIINKIKVNMDMLQIGHIVLGYYVPRVIAVSANRLNKQLGIFFRIMLVSHVARPKALKQRWVVT